MKGDTHLNLNIDGKIRSAQNWEYVILSIDQRIFILHHFECVIESLELSNLQNIFTQNWKNTSIT